MIAKRRFCVNCRVAPKLATSVQNAVPKRKFRAAFANTARNNVRQLKKPLLLPGQRSADDIAMRANGNLIRQLALRWQIAWNVLVVGCVLLQVRTPRMRIENDDILPVIFAHNIHRGDEIRIAAHKHKGLRTIVDSVQDHRRGNVDIRPLLLQFFTEQPPHEFNRIKPQVSRPLQQSIEEIESVNIGNSRLHGHVLDTARVSAFRLRPRSA